LVSIINIFSGGEVVKLNNHKCVLLNNINNKWIKEQ
jgi:hypothetical protein